MDEFAPQERVVLPWTGERFIPGEGGDIIALEHVHRYRLAQAFGAGVVVLDLGCGAGYGTTMLQDSGASIVVGVDVSFDAASFVKSQDVDSCIATSSATALALRDRSVDLVVCFEVIEHVESPELLVREAKRVLRPDGTFIVSTPNKSIYNEFQTDPNPYHLSEMELAEFHELLSRHFVNVRLWAQKVVLSSVVWDLDEADPRPVGSATSAPPAAPYLIAVCSDADVQPLETSAFSSWRMLEGLAEQSEHYSGYEARELAARDHIAALESTLEQTRSALTRYETSAREQVGGDARTAEDHDELDRELRRARAEVAAMERSRWVRLGRRLHAMPGVAAIDRALRGARTDDSIETETETG